MFGKIFGNRYKPKTACRVHVSKKPSPLKEFLLNSRKKPYLDIRLFRNNNEIAQVILEDTGFSKFTIIGIGTFLIPDETDRKMYFRKGRKMYLHYDLSSIKPFEPCNDLKPMGFKMPKIQPYEYLHLLENQSMADVCAEDVKDTNWFLYLAIAAIALIALFMFMR